MTHPFHVKSLFAALSAAGASRPLLGCCALLALLPVVAVAADEPAKEVEEVTVIGKGSQVTLPEDFAGGQVARGGRVGIFGNLDMMDTPFTSTNYTEDLIRAQQSKSVGDVLQNDPVVRVATGFGNFQELYVIRGFPIYSDDMTYNGLYGILPRQYVAAELLERVEVFRGSSAFLNGAAPSGSGLGGAVNLVPKRAGDEPSSSLSLGYEDGGQAYIALDTGTRFGEGDSTGVRVNAVARDGETSVENLERELGVLSVGLDYHSDQLRLSADVGFQDHHIDAPRPSVTPLGDIPKPPDADKNFAQPWTYTDERQLFGVVRGEYDLNDSTTVWVAGGMRDGEEDNLLSNPNALANGDTFSYRFDNFREDKIGSAETGLRTEFDTGSVGHRLIVSASSFSLESRNAYAFSNFTGFAGNLYDPVAVPPPPADFFVGGSMDDPHVTQETDTSSLAVADMMSLLDDKVIVTLGARQQNIQTGSFDYNTGAKQSSYDEGRVTPVVGLVFKPSEQVSIYGNYIEGLIPGEVAPENSGGAPVINAGEVLEPYQSEQYEAGVKYDADTLGGSLSLFTTSKPSAYVQDNVFSTFGEQRNRGIELSLFGQPLQSVRVLGGLTYLDAEMLETAGGVADGKEPIGTPSTQVNFNVEWDIASAPGLTLDARSVYTSDQYANAANSLTVESWTRFDLGARYSTELAGNNVSLRLRLENVTGENYWASVGGYPGSNYLVLGAPRTLVLSGTINF